jgi:sterol desaturase/sphingolipid hydroxylase (fatty acid hydroxylase superfamily)
MITGDLSRAFWDLAARDDVRAAARFPLADLGLVAAYFLLILSGLPSLFGARKLQLGSPRWQTIMSELVLSALALEIASVSVTLSASYLAQHGLLRAELTVPSVPRLLLHASISLLAYDFYIYVAHRLLHVGPLYTHVHSVHHRSTAPSPATAFAMHPLEAIMNMAFLPAFLALTPVNFYGATLAGLYMQATTIVLHGGHEVFPAWWRRSPMGRLLPTVGFHDRHHAAGRGNYGIITTIWDHVLGTVGRSDDTQSLVGRRPLWP